MSCCWRGFELDLHACRTSLGDPAVARASTAEQQPHTPSILPRPCTLALLLLLLLLLLLHHLTSCSGGLYGCSLRHKLLQACITAWQQCSLPLIGDPQQQQQWWRLTAGSSSSAGPESSWQQRQCWTGASSCFKLG